MPCGRSASGLVPTAKAHAANREVDPLDAEAFRALRPSTDRGVRTRRNVVLRFGVSVMGSGASIFSAYGTNSSYVDPMQRTFNRAEEKALLASPSYDLSPLGIDRLGLIANFVAGFDGELLGVRDHAQGVDAMLDYRVPTGWFRGLWLRVRGFWLDQENAGRDGSDVRLILRYDFPVL